MSEPDEWRGLTVADVMLRRPKALPSSSTVGDVRAMLGNPSVQMVLLADDGEFRGAITELPDEASTDDEALGYADRRPESIRPTEPASTGFELTARNPHRRIVVLDEQHALLGLLCLDRTRTRFCGHESHRATS
jgi:hypothetical protein